jgi:hypothetical protein
MIDLIEKIENLDFDHEEFLDKDFLMTAVGLAAGAATGPAGLALVTALSKANQLNNIMNVLIELIDKICKNPDINIDNSYFKKELENVLSDDNKKILRRVTEMKNIDIVNAQIDERWA